MMYLYFLITIKSKKDYEGYSSTVIIHTFVRQLYSITQNGIMYNLKSRGPLSGKIQVRMNERKVRVRDGVIGACLTQDQESGEEKY